MSEPTFKFQFRVTSSTGGRIEVTNNPGKSVTATQLREIADDFFSKSVPAQIERAESCREEVRNGQS